MLICCLMAIQPSFAGWGFNEEYRRIVSHDGYSNVTGRFPMSLDLLFWFKRRPCERCCEDPDARCIFVPVSICFVVMCLCLLMSPRNFRIPTWQQKVPHCRDYAIMRCPASLSQIAMVVHTLGKNVKGKLATCVKRLGMVCNSV